MNSFLTFAWFRLFQVVKYISAAILGIVLYVLCALYTPGMFNALQRAARTLYEVSADAILPESWVAITSQVHLEDKIVFAVFIITALIVMKFAWWSCKRPFKQRKR